MSSDLKLWNKGLTRCESCKAKLELSGMPPLELAACPECGEQVFTPMKVRGFWLYKPLGGGGMGSVFKSVHESLRGEFAVKILPRAKQHDKSIEENLMREAELGSRFGTHPNIVPVVEYGDDEGEFFLATEFVEGDRLDELIETEQEFTEGRALDIIRQLLAAERHIAECGCLYRDMKPQNVMVCKGGKVKLFDYGLCLPMEDCQAPDPKDELEGSPFYLPPERIVAAPEGEYSEIYSLGMVLFHMLAGRTYYSQAEISELVGKHLTSLRIASVGNNLQQCRPETIAMIDKMLARSPNARQPDFASLSEELEEVIKSAPKETAASISTSGSADVRGNSKLKLILSLSAALASACLFLFMLWSFFGDSGPSKSELRKTFAAQLNVKPDVKLPDILEADIKRMIQSRAAEIASKKTAANPPRTFDESGETAKALKELKLEEPLPKLKDLDGTGLEKLANAEMSRLVKEAVEKRFPAFDNEAERKRVATEASIPYPPPATSQPLDELENEFNSKITAEVAEKFPVKTLGRGKMDVMKKYTMWNEGEEVRLSCTDGRIVTGIYRGYHGGKALIGDTRVSIADIPLSELWHFDANANKRTIAEEIKATTEAFEKSRADYKSELEGKLKPDAFKAKGYTLAAGKPLPFEDFIKLKASEGKKSFDSEKAKFSKSTEASVKKGFDSNAFWSKLGYRKVKGKWVPADKAVAAVLQERKTALAKANAAAKAKIARQSMEEAAKQIYPAHNYAFAKGAWRPAKELLDEMVANEIADRKRRSR